MEISKLVETYSKDILDETNEERQNKAMISVITELSEEMKQRMEMVSESNLKRKEKKKEMEKILEDICNEYAEFVGEINKLAKKELLKPDGIVQMLKKTIKL